MYEYRVVNAHDYMIRPDDKRAQTECDNAAKDGWRLVNATASALGDSNGRLLRFFEREAR